MRLSIAASIAAIVACASVTTAQDATCTPLLVNYDPSASGTFQKCYTDQVYNAALVSSGASPDYKDIIKSVCSKPACAASTLSSATSQYITACGASIDAEAAASGGNILQLGKNALEVFFAEPIRDAYCALDPNAPRLPSPQVTPPAYCLATEVANPVNRFVSQLGTYLTGGSIRSTQEPFFLRNLDAADVCSPCSQIAVSGTVDYLSDNLMPRIAPFYTPEFVNYWTKFVAEYNKMCKTSIVQTWPSGTLKVTVPGVPTGNPSTDMPKPTSASAAPTSTPTQASAAGSLKPAGAVAFVAMVAAALF
ncbi:hypothetical protein BG006_004245 [Podila minutissima]|uniref:Uncharacterized protein n=1 Tax=Podila minutissima TaxID=64525 RepID=A0A9P5VMX4_9FUNG|nr:hypothetical protein BG006_004245 [Podila minutissima]